MDNNFIGREKEISLLKKAINDNKSKLITILGRRGNGKTTLAQYFVENELNDNDDFIKIDGSKGVASSIQVKRFLLNFKNCHYLKIKDDEINSLFLNKNDEKWFLVFDFLSKKLKQYSLIGRKLIIFIDEFPWLHTKKSNFIQAFSSFWNNIQNTENIYFIMTGSAVAWMNKNVINTAGGLYARIHTIINLKPLSFLETIDFLYKKNKYYSFNEYLSYYLMTGGVPRYLSKLMIENTIDDNAKLLFNNFFESEYDKLFTSSFESNLNLHKKFIDVFKHKRIYKISEIIKLNICKQSNVYNIIKDLTSSGLLVEIKNYDKIKHKNVKNHNNEKYYMLSDLFCYSYLTYSDNKQLKAIMDGYGFEIFARNNIDLILDNLGRRNIIAENFAWQNNKAQIDLINLANDNVCHIIECKNYNKEFVLSKDYEEKLINKITEFENILPNKHELKLVIFSTFGVQQKLNKSLHFIDLNLEKIVKNHLLKK